MAPSGNAAAMASAAKVFMSIDLFIFLPFRPRAYWARCLPPPLASHVPVLVVDIELLKINRFRRKTHLTGSLSVVTNLPMLVSCLPFPTHEHETHHLRQRLLAE